MHVEVYSIQHYVIQFVSDLQQVSGFLRIHLHIPTNRSRPRRPLLYIDVIGKSYVNFLPTHNVCFLLNGYEMYTKYNNVTIYLDTQKT
jgi:hypothetical protein